MKYCTQCGGDLSPGARFCSTCGTVVTQPGASIPPASRFPAPPPSLSETIAPRLRTSIPGFIRDALHPNEQIFAAVAASLLDHRRKEQFRHDKFVITNERIIYYHTAIIHKGMGQMPYRGITEIKSNRGWVHGTVIIEGANAALTISRISNDDAAFIERIISGIIAGRTFGTK